MSLAACFSSPPAAPINAAKAIAANNPTPEAARAAIATVTATVITMSTTTFNTLFQPGCTFAAASSAALSIDSTKLGF